MLKADFPYDLGAIRELLLAAFRTEELRRFCQDRPLFRPIFDRFGLSFGLDDMVDEVIGYCEVKLLWQELLVGVKQDNPRQYARFEHRLGGPPTSDEPGEKSPAVGHRPSPDTFGSAKVFVCYRQHVDPDERLAHYLYSFLGAQGHKVFIDAAMRGGEAWLERIDQQIKTSDVFVVLLSRESADSAMVKSEVRRADQYRRQRGKPQTLPVRIAYEGLLPYSIDAFLDPLQYVLWQNAQDDERMAREVLTAVEGRLEERVPIEVAALTEGLIISEDGWPGADDGAPHAPLPEFDPRFLEELEAPGGMVKLRDKFYIQRKADSRLKREIVREGTTSTIRAARQTGKTSLLVRGVHHAQHYGAKVVRLDLQYIDDERLKDHGAFMRDLAEFIVRKLRLDVVEVDKLWSGRWGPQLKLKYVLEDYVLPEADGQIVLALDEVDRLLQTDYYKDFFAMLRSWHNSRSEEPWQRLNIVLVISTEPYLLIPDVNQSPFNVGLDLYLEDFTRDQVQALNVSHGSPVREGDFDHLMRLLAGHPYLTRRALYTLVMEQMTWAELFRVAPSYQGPFGDHLRHLQWLLWDEPELRDALRQVVRDGWHRDELALFRLLRAGLIKGSGEVFKCRCDLYKLYFEDKL